MPLKDLAEGSEEQPSGVHKAHEQQAIGGDKDTADRVGGIMAGLPMEEGLADGENSAQKDPGNKPYIKKPALAFGDDYLKHVADNKYARLVERADVINGINAYRIQRQFQKLVDKHCRNGFENNYPPGVFGFMAKMLGLKRFKKPRVEPDGCHFYFPTIKGSKNDDFSEINELSGQLMKDPSPLIGPDSTERTELIEKCARQYKIHIQPQTEFIPAIVESLLVAINADTKLRESIIGFKVDILPRNRGNMPTIVLYVRPGKENAQHALDGVYASLHKYHRMGEGNTPRFSKKVDELISYAQFSGDVKKSCMSSLARGDNPNIPFDGRDWAHFKGEEHKLILPKPSELDQARDRKAELR